MLQSNETIHKKYKSIQTNLDELNENHSLKNKNNPKINAIGEKINL
jgi:hypothetical protein